MAETASSAPPPLSIAVIGAGGIGSAFADRLARAGHRLTVVARPGSPRLAQLQRDGGVQRIDGQLCAMEVRDALDEQASYDLVIVTVLDHQVDPLLPVLRRSRAGCVHFMFNTYDPERLRNAVGAERCSFGMPFIMAHLEEEGRLDSTITASRRTLHGQQRWVDLFNAAGIFSEMEPNMPQWLRCHVPMCVAMESISMAGVRRGGGASWAEAQTVARGVKGGFAIIEGRGQKLYPASKGMIRALPTPLAAAMLWGVSRNKQFRELLATGVNECRALIDALAASAGDDPALRGPASAVRAMKPIEELCRQ